MTDEAKQLKALRDWHIGKREEFRQLERNAKGQSQPTLNYLNGMAAKHDEWQQFLQSLAARHGYRID